MYKARIKILVKETGAAEFTRLVEEEWEHIREDLLLDGKEIERVKAFFTSPDYDSSAAADTTFESQQANDPAFAAWVRHNTGGTQGCPATVPLSSR